MSDADQSIVIKQAGKPLVTIKPDGTLEYGDGYTPDKAARAFWAAVGLARVTPAPEVAASRLLR